jgi:hypothetical protein
MNGAWRRAVRFRQAVENIVARLTASKEKAQTTNFSDFIRNASPVEKEKVYTEVMERATKRQIEEQ